MKKLKAGWEWLKSNLALAGTIAGTIAGAIGTTLTPILGQNLADNLSQILQTVSGVLLAISMYHVSSVAAAKSKLKMALKVQVGGALGAVHPTVTVNVK